MRGLSLGHLHPGHLLGSNPCDVLGQGEGRGEMSSVVTHSGFHHLLIAQFCSYCGPSKTGAAILFLGQAPSPNHLGGSEGPLP